MTINRILCRCAYGALLFVPFVAQATTVGPQVPAYISLRLFGDVSQPSALRVSTKQGIAPALHDLGHTRRASRRRGARNIHSHNYHVHKRNARLARNRQRCMQAHYDPTRTRHRCTHFLIRQGPLARPRISL